MHALLVQQPSDSYMRRDGDASEIIPLVKRTGNARVGACKPRGPSFDLKQTRNLDAVNESLEVACECDVVQTHRTSPKVRSGLAATQPAIEILPSRF